MSVLSDRDILAEIEAGHLVIGPFEAHKVRHERMPSYGLQSAGYDLRLGTRFLRTHSLCTCLDLRTARPADWVEEHCAVGEAFVLHPGQAVLAEVLEFLKLPAHLSGRIWGKSTWARQFVSLNTTIVEPGWFGHLTLEASNVGNTPVALFPGYGIAQVEFQRLSSPPIYAYAGSYQGQRGATPAGPTGELS